MSYDPAWDMPRVNWQQQGSFEVGELPPVTDPDSGTMVCLPPINQDWLPFIQGCLSQMRNPSSWLVIDDDAMNATLQRVERLMQMVGERADCPMPLELQMSGCDLQYSTDGGTTFTTVTGWSDFLTNCIPLQTIIDFDSDCSLNQSYDGGETFTPVAGWFDNFSNCVQENGPIIGLPPNPGDKTPDQLACAIAAYAAEQVVIAAMGKAVTAISDDLTLLQFGLDVVNIIPEFVLVTLAADAFSAIYVAVQEGMLSDFEDALTDATLLQDITCAVYDCIQAEGYVKPDNFSCILSNIGAISYAHADVISAIVSYLTALGPTGLAQLSQVSGLHSGEDCTACAGSGWCFLFDFTLDAGPFLSYDTGVTSWVSGVGWVGTYRPAAVPPCVESAIYISPGPFNGVTEVDFFFTASEDAAGSLREMFLVPVSGVTEHVPAPGGSYSTPERVGATVDDDYTEIGMINRSSGSTSVNVITSCIIKGTGTNPFGTSNCL